MLTYSTLSSNNYLMHPNNFSGLFRGPQCSAVLLLCSAADIVSLYLHNHHCCCLLSIYTRHFSTKNHIVCNQSINTFSFPTRHSSLVSGPKSFKLWCSTYPSRVSFDSVKLSVVNMKGVIRLSK